MSNENASIDFEPEFGTNPRAIRPTRPFLWLHDATPAVISGPDELALTLFRMDVTSDGGDLIALEPIHFPTFAFAPASAVDPQGCWHRDRRWHHEPLEEFLRIVSAAEVLVSTDSSRIRGIVEGLTPFAVTGEWWCLHRSVAWSDSTPNDLLTIEMAKRNALNAGVMFDATSLRALLLSSRRPHGESLLAEMHANRQKPMHRVMIEGARPYFQPLLQQLGFRRDDQFWWRDVVEQELPAVRSWATYAGATVVTECELATTAHFDDLSHTQWTTTLLANRGRDCRDRAAVGF